MAPAPSEMKGVAFITGAASGIGRACASTFAKEGCSRFVLVDLTDDLRHVVDELKKLESSVDVVTVKADVGVEEDVERAVEEGVKKFGAIHYAVNSAGITSNPRVRTHELSTESWDAVLKVNLRGTWLCQRAELRQLMKQQCELIPRTGAPPQRGAIVNLSSLFGILSHPTVGAYSATKAGVLGMTRTDALAYAADGIRVNAVLPGFTKTPMVEESMRRGADYESMISTIPVRRWGTAEEIAEAVVFLCSEKASLITGVDLVVDGGKCYAS